MQSQFPQKHIYNPADTYGGFKPNYGSPISDSSGSRGLDRARFSTPGRRPNVRQAEKFAQERAMQRVAKTSRRRMSSQVGYIPAGFLPHKSIGRKIVEFFRSLF